MLSSYHFFNVIAEIHYCRGFPGRNGNPQRHNELYNRELFPSLRLPAIPQEWQLSRNAKVSVFPDTYINIFSNNEKNIIEVKL